MKIQKYSKDLINKIKNYYIDTNFSFDVISDNSQELFGRQISTADMKYMSRSDADGSWSLLRANGGRKTADVPVREKLERVADRLYELIIDDNSEVSSNQVAQVARTWSDLIDKAKLNTGVTSAKSTAQQAKDLFEKEMLNNAKR